MTAPRHAAAPPIGSGGYLPSLDGLRAVSIALVVVSHTGLGWLVPGGLGVTVFFVISGFLITQQILQEVGRTGRLDLRGFYLRRVFRLAPALLVYVAAFTPLTSVLGAANTAMETAAALLYASNYWLIYVGFPDGSPFSILWSLAVEEHFYLLFPVAVLLLRRSLRALVVGMVALVVLALLWRMALSQACTAATWSYALCGLPEPGTAQPSSRHYFATDTRFDTILFGCLLACALRFRPDACRRALLGPGPFTIAAIALLATLAIRDPWFRDTARYSVQGLSLAVILGNILFGPLHPVRACLSHPAATYVGRLSYSLYLFHWGVLVVFEQAGHRVVWWKPEVVAFYAMTFALAAACHACVERPMLGVRRRLGSLAAR